MRTGIVVGAAPLGREAAVLRDLINANENLYIVAADGGIRFFLEEGICPSHWIGDMDSNNLSDEVMTAFPELRINTCSPIKDVTDMEIGISDAINNECDKVLIFGGTGGKRVSHTIANIQLLSGMKQRGIDVIMYGDGIRMRVLKGREQLFFDSSDKGFVSVLALSDMAKNVVIKGLFYEYVGNLSNNSALGVSNELTGNDASIELEEGLLLVIEEDK